MIFNMFARANRLLSVVGVIASAGGLILILGRRLSPKDLWLSILSIAAAFIAGLSSKYIAQFARRLSPSHRVFLSYAHSDQPAATEIATLLRSKGAHVWFDLDRVKPGESIRDAIEHAMEDADTFVVLLSNEPSRYLTFELGVAQAKGLRVIPVLLNDAEVPLNLQDVQYIDLRHERSHGLEKLVSAAT